MCSPSRIGPSECGPNNKFQCRKAIKKKNVKIGIILEEKM
jgi:hypothetical protein